MTFNNNPWALDGATINSALARSSTFAQMSGNEGIVERADLQVAPLEVPSTGIRIMPGAAVVLNRYQSPRINQAYTVINPEVHTYTSMPAPVPYDTTYIVAVVVGDPEFSQEGHPFMLASDPPAGEESTFDYVRPVVMTETAFNNRTFPALALARLHYVANASAVTADMIEDLRALARPRNELVMATVLAPASQRFIDFTYPDQMYRWPDTPGVQCNVPYWAVKAKVLATIEGARVNHGGICYIQVGEEFGGARGPLLTVDENLATVFDLARTSLTVSAELDIQSRQGQLASFSVFAGYDPNVAGSNAMLASDANTRISIQVYFEEQPVGWHA